jgi:transposase InsO family protein
VRLGKIRFESKYLSIQYFHQEKGWSIRWMCRQLQISKAAYYKWLHRSVPQAEQENTLLAELIQEYDEQYNHILGYRRMTLWINRLNRTHFSKNRIHRIMKAIGIHSVIRKQPKKYRKSTPERTAENVLKRDFTASKPNEKWATDVTEFKWYEGPVCHKLYLSAILDLYDRSVVAYVLSRRNDNRLVFHTFDKAIADNPDAKPIFHSDRGFQYTSPYFQSKLSSRGMVQSMSRVGHCIDNGPTEGFWGIIKAEMYYLHKFEDETALRSAIERYIHFYNCERFQERFGNRTPMEVRMEALNSDEAVQYPIPENKRIQKYKEKFAS